MENKILYDILKIQEELVKLINIDVLLNEERSTTGKNRIKKSKRIIKRLISKNKKRIKNETKRI